MLSARFRRQRISFRRFLRKQDGTVAVMLALALTALLGMGALAIDLGRAWNLDTELQNAADAAALVCASQLDRDPGARARSQLAATGALQQNTQTFASDGLGDNVTIQNTDIVFYSSLSPKTVATSDAMPPTARSTSTRAR